MATLQFAQWNLVQTTWADICYKWNSPIIEAYRWDVINDNWDVSPYEWDATPTTSMTPCPPQILPTPTPSPTPLIPTSPKRGVGFVFSNAMSIQYDLIAIQQQQKKLFKLKEVKNCSVILEITNNFYTKEQSRMVKFARAYPTYEESIKNFPLKVLKEETHPQYKNVYISGFKIYGNK